jgi:hypothetical protein
MKQNVRLFSKKTQTVWAKLLFAKPLFEKIRLKNCRLRQQVSDLVPCMSHGVEIDS